MNQELLLLLLLTCAGLSIREFCMIEVIQRQVRYKSFKYANISEEKLLKTFQIFSENGNLIQQEIIQQLVINFDLLPEVRPTLSLLSYILGVSMRAVKWSILTLE